MENIVGKSDQRRKLYQAPQPQNDSKNFRKLKTAIIISSLFIGCELLGGYISKSIAIFSDAFHLMTDLLGFMVSYTFLSYSRKKPTDLISFGYHRMQLVGALTNLFIIWGLAFFLIYEATTRIMSQEFVQEPFVMLIVSCGGLCINILMYFILNGDQNTNNNKSTAQSIDGKLFETETQRNCDPQLKLLSLDGDEDYINFYINSKGKQPIKQNIKNKQNSPSFIKLTPNNELQDYRLDFKKLSQDKTSTETDLPLSKINQVINDEINSQTSHKIIKNIKVCGKKKQNKENIDERSNYQSIGMKAALYHAISDVIQSLGIMISSIFICFLGSDNGKTVTSWNNWHYLDPISTYIFTFFVVLSTWPVLKSCYYLIMQATPQQYNRKELYDEFCQYPGVADVHDLHIWDLRPGKTILIAHVFATKGKQRSVLIGLTEIARKKKIYHSTFQVQEQQYKNNEQYILCNHDIHE